MERETTSESHPIPLCMFCRKEIKEARHLKTKSALVQTVVTGNQTHKMADVVTVWGDLVKYTKLLV